ncbi:MAG TPA: hypothetical protein VFZ34_06520, partial [Blastocatellia bacterium]|nr:hypothetical protein [Blastocatellia bacterium]
AGAMWYGFPGISLALHPRRISTVPPTQKTVVEPNARPSTAMTAPPHSSSPNNFRQDGSQIIL